MTTSNPNSSHNFVSEDHSFPTAPTLETLAAWQADDAIGYRHSRVAGFCEAATVGRQNKACRDASATRLALFRLIDAKAAA